MAETKGNVTVTEQNTTPAHTQAPIRRETPAVLNVFPSLLRGKQVLKTRLLQYPRGTPVLDIREFVTSEAFTGFTKKGLTLDEDQCNLLLKILPAAIEAMHTK